MKNKSAVFKYKTIKGPLHKIPALIKLALLLPVSIICMSLPLYWLAVGIGAAIITAFLCRFTIREQLTDLKPALYYAALMYGLSVFSNLFENQINLYIFIPEPAYLQIILRLTLVIQISALLFRTTSSLEIREGLCRINKQLGTFISLFLSFIPQIFENWNIINNAWKARGGRNGLRKIKTTIFLLISLSMEKASLKAKALGARNEIIK
ncbi:MAG: energy-coupling factor transporter transmembrane protein EcfT [Treponema sp.]|jgi:biotin transport system permease protein/energy-coupling factor transport system permease protein|nr:energy-coupling factor transporter transmembrane protein EcfT [Treponema sp.]